jgi:hypothetical protein
MGERKSTAMKIMNKEYWGMFTPMIAIFFAELVTWQ